MRNFKLGKSLLPGLLSVVCALALASCGVPAPQPSGSAPSSTAAPSPAAAGSSAESTVSAAAAATLYIGLPDHLKEAPAANAATAEELLRALEKETGWNLALAQAPSPGNEKDTLKIAFSEDSAIYNAPPDPQKEAYHVYDSEDYVLTVLNSVSETLCKNLGLDGVYFTAPDGGVLTLTNGGYSFCFSNLYSWDYDLAQSANTPLSPDQIGDCYVNPNGEYIVAMSSPLTLQIVFRRNNMRQLPGTLTVYNEDGSVFETAATDDTSKVRVEPIPAVYQNFYNLKDGEGTCFGVYLTKDLVAGEKYSVSVTPGAFESDTGLTFGAISQEQWSFQCLDMEVAVTPRLGNEPMIKIDQPVTYHFQFSDDVKRVYMENSEQSADYTCSPQELTSSGDMVITPHRLGKVTWAINVELQDGSTVGFTEHPTVVS